ncbi:ATP-binding protein [Streptomyces sp. NPDC087901]|uniref:ATP-binding protein n=1 Tax=Streptomyces sp. NPDC087901 TaxID=3365818 RepID=UPI0037F45C31
MRSCRRSWPSAILRAVGRGRAANVLTSPANAHAICGHALSVAFHVLGATGHVRALAHAILVPREDSVGILLNPNCPVEQPSYAKFACSQEARLRLLRVPASGTSSLRRVENWAMTLAAIGRRTFRGKRHTDGRPGAVHSRSFEMCVARVGGQLTDLDRRQPMRLRRVGCAVLSSWGLHRCREDAALVISELVTNAILHGHGPVSLRMVDRQSILEVSVGSDGPVPDLAVRLAGDDDEFGRGLILVRAVAEAWGVRDGRVWCTLLSGAKRAQ